MNTASLCIIALGTLAFAIFIACDSQTEKGFLMWFERCLAVASALTSMTCLGLAIWRIAS